MIVSQILSMIFNAKTAAENPINSASMLVFMYFFMFLFFLVKKRQPFRAAAFVNDGTQTRNTEALPIELRWLSLTVDIEGLEPSAMAGACCIIA